MKSPLWVSLFLLSFLLSASCFPLSGGSEGMSLSSGGPPSAPVETTIPGPLRSFQRMAGISPKTSSDEVLPLLAHETNVRGYDHHKATEYLLLLRRYLQQARELVALAGPDAVIRVSNCDDAAPLLAILGYQLRQPCGPNTTLQVADSGKAFLASDSGFPLAALEEALRAGQPFVLPYSSSRAPVLLALGDWAASSPGAKPGNAKADLVDILVHSPASARLYSAFAGMDSETALALRQSLGLPKLVRISKELDFYGGHLFIRSGKVLVPGGPAAEPAWKELVGADPGSPGEFVSRLMTTDAGWLGSYFDALSYADPEQQAYLTEPRRLRRFYSALHGKDILPGPASAIWRSDPGFWLLVVRLQLDGDQPAVPGNLEVWKEIVRRNRDTRRDRDWASRAERWNTPDQLLEGMFALSRDVQRAQPLDIYLTLTEIDRRRPPQERLTPATVTMLADRFWRLGDQYSVFSEFPGLSNESIVAYLKTADALDRIPSPVVRANAIGIFQSNLGLWEILVRQSQISGGALNQSWQSVIAPFVEAHSSAQLFDAGRASLGELLSAAAGTKDLSQDEIINMLAGPNLANQPAQKAREELAARMRGAMDSQRLVSLDTLFALGTGLEQLAQGKANPESLVPLAAQLREFEMPRPIFARSLQEIQSGRETSDIRHTTLQTRTDLQKIIRSGSAKDREEARARLAPFLRDTLVGLNYTYYEPPGAQMLFNNAIFVRSHDYSDSWAAKGVQPWTAPRLVSLAGSSAGGHLAGSLSGLPYALAEVEQNFIVPDNVQSLIWEDFVPTLLTSAVLPRFWGVTEPELHAVTLYQRAGEELFRNAADNEKLRGMVMEILSHRMPPQKTGIIEAALRNGQRDDAVAQLLPGETFYLAAEFRRRFPQEDSAWGEAGKELQSLAGRYPQEVGWERIARDFGVPHPALAHTYALDLPGLKPFPTFESYSSRLMAESWDSNNLYWARLADELGYPPAMLNRLVPALTHRMVEKLFATNLEDWSAVSRAMRETGEEFRQGKIVPLPKSAVASRQ